MSKLHDPEEYTMGDEGTNRVYVDKAPEPGDIIWENVHVKTMRRWMITVGTFMLCLILLIPCFFIITFLYTKKSSYSQTKQGASSNILTSVLEITITMGVLIVNVGIEIYILVFSNFERQMTNSDKELSILMKIVLLKFLNACLIPLLSNPNSNDWFKPHGLVSEIVLIIILLNLSEVFRLIFNIGFLYRWALRKFFEKKGDKWELTQKQANYLFQNDPTDFSKTLGVIIVFVLTILFYTPLVPGLTVYGIFGSILLYLVLKILIVRRKIILKNISANLVVRASHGFKMGVLANSIWGYFFFNRVLENESTLLSINLILGILFFILPSKRILFYIFRISDDEEEEGEYEDWIKNFKHYDKQNPITQTAAISRLKGRTLKDGIARGILKKLKKSVEIQGKVAIEDVENNSLGIEGFGLLIDMKKDISEETKRRKEMEGKTPEIFINQLNGNMPTGAAALDMEQASWINDESPSAENESNPFSSSLQD